jgi:putative transposase
MSPLFQSVILITHVKSLLSIDNFFLNFRLSTFDFRLINDAAWATFRQWLEYFGFKYGKVTIAVPPHNTSQNCSSCGKKVKKSLSTRTHVCQHCGFVEDRDVNAAINILKLALCTVGRQPPLPPFEYEGGQTCFAFIQGTYAWGDLPSWAIGAILSSNGESLNQESPDF